ncbi:MAG: Lrp/AsnC family transcriptional regulator [Syntrophobacteraceae bacterium]
MDSINRVILDRVQRSFPIVSHPYRALTQGLGISESEALERIASLKQERVIRQISAIFNTGALGYRTSLVAMAVLPEELERVASVINAYPGVSHNYLRPGDFNMWFTIAVPPGESLEEVVSRLSAKAGNFPSLILPALKKYKLAVVLDVLEEGDWEASEEKTRLPPTEAGCGFEATPENIALVKCIQEDLPLVPRPFALWADTLNLTEAQLLEIVSNLTCQGAVRRFAAVLNHRQVGFRANGMVVWDCPQDRMDAIGAILATYPEVSHCYSRPACPPQWPYNLYAMIHGRSGPQCEEIANRLAQATGLGNFRILFSTREYKKVRLKLFWDDQRQE